MNIISLQNIKQSFAASSIFNGVSLEINENERVGIIGGNGTGKTTLLKIIAGILKPEEGFVSWKKDTTIGFLQQIPEFEDDLSIYEIMNTSFDDLIEINKCMKELEFKLQNDYSEEILKRYGNCQEEYIKKGGYEIESKIKRVVNGLGIVSLQEKRWGQLSGGERTKVGLGLILLKEPNLLLLDEPTNHLDLTAIDWLAQFLKTYKGTILLVSHDRYFLDEITTKIVEVEKEELTTYHTNYSGYLIERDERILREFQQYQDQQKKIKKMKEAIKRLKDWANRSNPPSESLHRRAKNMEKALNRIEVIQKPSVQKNMKLDLAVENRGGDDVFYLENISKSYEGFELFTDVNLSVKYGERIAIVGDNGCGKTTLIKIITKQLNPSSGNIKHGSSLSIGYLSQYADEMCHEYTVLQEFRDKITLTETECRKILAKFLFYGDSVYKKVSSLSGGERMRLRWAEIVNERNNVLILDEPTNHLDIASKEALEDALSQYKGTIIAISHDRYFLDKFFNTIYWMEDKNIKRYHGNFSFAKEKRAAALEI
ncbi:ATPase subunit of ABC transporter with duplicated ATPase domains [Mobilisporobacter senegalensis]|uniref:ATPase subunit of ABC transporter with duplicated ATPase domains n=1 Tax=Mobilisporobacter senegalensis TaxID=1329262 RepID=A0A3N1XAU6_9FIRM|nr:ABC-F type ribosomal protection protein [Mobilisporobacter senegalensis]ROR23870.1 ATPase subunit of ABC transporter with duplicated ATPase domains [Mobilisporobacter senegalensis]